MTKHRRGDPQLISTLARGETIARAAKEAGVSERTVYRRLENLTFRLEISEARRIIFNQATGRLLMATETAINTLIALLSAESESVRLGATRSLLDYMIRMRELSEIDNRLQEVETLLNIRGSTP